MTNLIYREEQKYGKLQVFLATLLLVISIVLYIGSVMGNAQQPVPDFVLMLSLFVAMVVFVYIRLSRLVTEINSKTLLCKFMPFHRKKKAIQLENIKYVEVIKLPLASKLNGWHVEFDTMKNMLNKYILYRRNGVKIIFKNNEEFFIGSKQPEILKDAIDSQMKDSYLK